MTIAKRSLLFLLALWSVGTLAIAGQVAIKEFRHGAERALVADERIAPLTIRTTSGENYFVKLVDAVSGQAVMYLMIEGGRPLETLVPLGTYRIRYAAGKQWISVSELFGDKTLTSEAEQNFHFRRTADGISGYQIELILQRSGNLRTKTISRSQF